MNDTQSDNGFEEAVEEFVDKNSRVILEEIVMPHKSLYLRKQKMASDIVNDVMEMYFEEIEDSAVNVWTNDDEEGMLIEFEHEGVAKYARDKIRDKIGDQIQFEKVMQMHNVHAKGHDDANPEQSFVIDPPQWMYEQVQEEQSA